MQEQMMHQMMPPMPQLSMFRIRKRSAYESVVNQIPTVLFDSTMLPKIPQPIIGNNLVDYPDPSGLMITENSYVNKQYSTMRDSYGEINSNLTNLVQPYNQNQKLGDVNGIAQEQGTERNYTRQYSDPRNIDTFGRKVTYNTIPQFSEAGDNPNSQINRDWNNNYYINGSVTNVTEIPSKGNFVLYSSR